MTESQAAQDSARSLGGVKPSHAEFARRWRLPFSYRAIPAVALFIDIALIAASALGAEIIYNGFPYDAENEFSHSMAATIFVAILFVAVMRVQKLYDPAQLVLMEDQTRSVLSAWCGAFLILASGVFTWGVSHDLSRGDILLFWAFGVVALLAHRSIWWFVLPRALESGALRGRTAVSLTCEDSVPPRFIENLTRHGYHLVGHFHLPAAEEARDGVIDHVISLCRTSEIEEVVLFVDPERMANVRAIAKRLRVLPLPVTFVPFGTLAQLFQRAHNDIGDTVAIELQRAALTPFEQAAKRTLDILVSMTALVLLSPIMLAVAIAIKLDFERAGLLQADATRVQWTAFRHLQIPFDDRDGGRRRCDAGAEERRSRHPGREMDPALQCRRTSPASECAEWGDVDCRPKAPCVSARPFLHLGHRKVCFPASCEIRDNGVGSGLRRARRDRHPRQDAKAG